MAPTPPLLFDRTLVAIPPPPEAVYASHDEAEAAIHAWSCSHGFKLSRRRARRTGEDNVGSVFARHYECDRAGKPKNTAKLRDEDRVRVKRGSKRIGCPMRIGIQAVNRNDCSGPWKVCHMSNSSELHNHPPSSTMRAGVRSPSQPGIRSAIETSHLRSWMTTPSVMVDLQRLQRNVDGMQRLAHSNTVQLRPHIKTHKTLEIAARQLEAGAVGLTVSKPSEALVFLQSELIELKSVLLAYPVVQSEKVVPLLEAAKATGKEFQITIDSVEGLKAVQQAASESGYMPKVLIHIDVGYHRVGLEESDPRIEELALRVHRSPHLMFTGILSHAGHAYACTSAEESAEVAEIERQIMVRVKESLEKLGVPVPTISVGSTLTELPRKNFAGITEIRPGNYVFLDRTPIRMGLISIQHVALSVLVTVVSSNRYHFIVDAGSKVLSSDAPRTGDLDAFGSKCFGLVFLETDFELLETEPTRPTSIIRVNGGRRLKLQCWEVKKLSEEHGWVKQEDGVTAPPIGTRMIILPNHSCVVANLSNQLYIQGERPETWKTVSRGCTQ